MKNIFITGVAGFIGYSLANYFLNKNYKVMGIDNFDDYYSIKIKKKRLQNLLKNKNFKFKKIDISSYSKVDYVIKNSKIDYLIHLAAQAGVRYSLVNPNKYLDVNINGYLNLIKSIQNKKIKKFIYASSSSVYGDSIQFPLKETDKLNPKNIYGLSKKMNEEIAEYYSKIYPIDFIGLRFFTVYGEWGRPDMFLFKLLKSSRRKKFFYLNNYGNHLRDFTYIGDILEIFDKLLKLKCKQHEIFNICSNNPVNILKIVKKFKKNNFLKLKLVDLHKADVLKTHGDNKKIRKFLKIDKFSSFDNNFAKIISWYDNNQWFKID